MSEDPLAGLRVLEIGSRLAVAAGGRLLADLGAVVFVTEPRVGSSEGKWVQRALATAGKHSILFDSAVAEDVAALVRLAATCDVALVSRDVDQLPAAVETALADVPIVCDITAFGASGPLAGQPADEFTIQALCGLMDTTGFADGGPAAIGVPIVELSTGIYSAVAVCLAWRVLEREGVGQTIDLALFDTAFNALTTFLPSHFAGKAPRRLGNGHSMAVPWNAYQARDGWVLICSASDAQWQKLARTIDPALAADVRYAALADRIEHRTEIDGAVAQWVGTHTLAPLVERLKASGIACGAIVALEHLGEEPNIVHRGTITTVRDPLKGTLVQLPRALIRFDAEPSPLPSIPMPDDGRVAGVAARPRPRPRTAAPYPPLAGLRVVEIGQFTTAPLAARHLATFGADVIKIEPAEGDSARAWAPHRDGISAFFMMSNGTKRSAALDLRSDDGRAAFAEVLASADVLVENMKPGSLERLGFDNARLRALNPRLVYCAISGFGAHSVYAGRPAFDTVVQAMCGMMDATCVDGVPLKAGISAADIGGGQVGLLAIIAAVIRRERTGRGAMIDIAMQDVGAWLTQTRWNGVPAPARYTGPVATVAQVCANPHTLARELILIRRDARGTEWELLGSPLRLSATPPHIGPPLGPPVPGVPRWYDEHEREPLPAAVPR